MVKVFSREIETASANPMLLMKPVVIYVLDVGVRTITRPKGPAVTQSNTVTPRRFWCPRSYTSGALKNMNMVPLVRISELLSRWPLVTTVWL